MADVGTVAGCQPDVNGRLFPSTRCCTVQQKTLGTNPPFDACNDVGVGSRSVSTHDLHTSIRASLGQNSVCRVAFRPMMAGPRASGEQHRPASTGKHQHLLQALASMTASERPCYGTHTLTGCRIALRATPWYWPRAMPATCVPWPLSSVTVEPTDEAPAPTRPLKSTWEVSAPVSST